MISLPSTHFTHNRGFSASSIVELHQASTEPIQSDGITSISESSKHPICIDCNSLIRLHFMLSCVSGLCHNPEIFSIRSSETWTNPLPLMLLAGLTASFMDQHWPSHRLLDSLYVMSLIFECARAMDFMYRVHPLVS